MARLARTRVRGEVYFGLLAGACITLGRLDTLYTDWGYRRTSVRLWKREDGTHDARVVWRSRGPVASTMVNHATGLKLQ